MWIKYNPNPSGRMVGDCSVRAVSRALDLNWEKAYVLTANSGYYMRDMPSADAVWGAVLRDHGFHRYVIPDSCPDCYTAENFCQDHPHGIYVLGFGGHTATVVDGNIYDSWDSSREIPQYFWRE